MGIDWAHAGPAFVTAFFASLVEFIEALTVVLAVGAVRGWGGAGLALTVLLSLVVILGPALRRIQLDMLQLVVGALMVLFGMRWLRKAILRAAGTIPLHDEVATYARQRQVLQAMDSRITVWDRVAVAMTFQITMIEGIEVVFIVTAIGTAGASLLTPAGLGALAALGVVILLGLLLHRPIAMIPENTLKFIVGTLISAFGTFWLGEGMGLVWPGEDWSLVALNAGFLLVALIAISICRQRPRGTHGETPA